MTDTESSQARLDRLRQEVEGLVPEHPAPASTRSLGQVEAAMATGAGALRGYLDAVSGFIQAQPLAAVAAFAAAGWLLGRTLRRRR